MSEYIAFRIRREKLERILSTYNLFKSDEATGFFADPYIKKLFIDLNHYLEEDKKREPVPKSNIPA